LHEIILRTSVPGCPRETAWGQPEWERLGRPPEGGRRGSTCHQPADRVQAAGLHRRSAVFTLGLNPGGNLARRSEKRLSTSAQRRVDAAVNHIAATTTSDTSPSVLLTYQATGYKYLQVASGQEPPDWQDSGFDDSSWSVGQAGFGSGGGCSIQSTNRTHWDTNTSMLLRKHVSVPAGTTEVNVGVAVDNDTTVYWNGTPIGSGAHEGCAELDEFVFPVPSGAVNAGDNFLAVEGIDRGAESFLDVTVTGVLGNAPCAVASTTSGSVAEVAPPPSLLPGAFPSDTQISFFREQQDVALSNALSVDTSTSGATSVPSGTRVSSFFLHANSSGPTIMLSGS
jgi:hypothetical protein